MGLGLFFGASRAGVSDTLGFWGVVGAWPVFLSFSGRCISVFSTR